MKVWVMIEDADLGVGQMLGPLAVDPVSLPGDIVTVWHQYGYARYYRLTNVRVLVSRLEQGRFFNDTTLNNILNEIENAVPADDAVGNPPVRNRIVVIERDEDTLQPAPAEEPTVPDSHA